MATTGSMVVEGLLDSNGIMLKWLDSWLDKVG